MLEPLDVLSVCGIYVDIQPSPSWVKDEIRGLALAHNYATRETLVFPMVDDRDYDHFVVALLEVVEPLTRIMSQALMGLNGF